MLKNAIPKAPGKPSRGPKAEKIHPSRLLDAAQAVFARNGLEGGSVRAIAREAGCDPSLLYYHFENKEAIFEAILDRKFALLLPDLEAAGDFYEHQPAIAGIASTTNHGRTPLQEALQQILMVFRKHVKDDVGFRNMIRWGVAASKKFTLDEILFNHFSPAMQIIGKMLVGGIESGELRKDINIPMTTFFFVRTYIDVLDFFPMLTIRFIQLPSEDAIELAEKQWFRLFWAGISNPSKISGAN
ncbi:MAG: TetR/AcrR family transcriptional regulator [Holophagaceae bacterium]|jgi:AcrR family transcriptional regulator|nr:TetR/AcrR family transcriptional regulator [Holophagaceae bacterium]